MELTRIKAVDAYVAFPMVDKDSPESFKTGETVSDAAFSKDGAGAWTTLSLTDTTSEIASTGMYEIDISSTEMNHDQIIIKFTATNSQDQAVVISTIPGPANVKSISDDSTAADNLESACDNYSAARGLAGTALPDAAADAAGGLPISDAGGLDMDAILADTNEIQGKLPSKNYLTGTNNSDGDIEMNESTGNFNTTQLASLQSIAENAITSSEPIDANVIQIDGQATSGNNATLNLKQLNIQNSAGDAVYAKSTGGSGDGIHAEGNSTGLGINAVGQQGIRGSGTAGAGIYASGSSNQPGIKGAGSGTGAGIEGEGTPGILGSGNGANGHGIEGQGDTACHGIKGTKGTGGKDIDCDEIDDILTDTGDMQPKLGTPKDLGAGASLSSMLLDMSSITIGTISFDRTTDSLEAIANKSCGITKATDFNNFTFLMVDSTDHVTPKTGLTITGSISKDGAAFASLTNSVSEVGNGVYKVNLSGSGDLNIDFGTLRFTANGADARYISFKTESSS